MLSRFDPFLPKSLYFAKFEVFSRFVLTIQKPLAIIRTGIVPIFDYKFNGYNATNKGNRAAAYITEYFINLFYLSLIERKLRIKEAMLYEARFYKKLIKDEIDMRKFKKTNYWREYVPKNISDYPMLQC